MKEFYSIKEVAEILNFKERTVRKWIECKEINAVKILGCWRISKEELERLKRGGINNGEQENV